MMLHRSSCSRARTPLQRTASELEAAPSRLRSCPPMPVRSRADRRHPQPLPPPRYSLPTWFGQSGILSGGCESTAIRARGRWCGSFSRCFTDGSGIPSCPRRGTRATRSSSTSRQSKTPGYRRDVEDERVALDTLIFNVTPEQDPRLPAGGRVLVYLRSSFNGVTRQARDTAITTVQDTGFLELFSCNSVRRVEEAKSELQLLGEPQWRAP